ncbi:Trans-acting enoyl reductase, partial [Zancudomyces culisetae]
MSETNERQYDILIWGVTGFTGTLVYEYFLEHGNEDLRVAVGGRNEEKIQKILDNYRDRYTQKVKKTGVFVCDSSDEKGLTEIVSKTLVVISTVGPFARYGEPIVAACANMGTDYCDITGELPWVNRMDRKYTEIAAKNKAHIVSMCGFDCIPSELGGLMVTKEIKDKYKLETRDLKATFFEYTFSPSGGTIETMFDVKLEKNIENDTYAYIERKKGIAGLFSMLKMFRVYYDRDFKRWQSVFPSAFVDIPVVLRTNHFNKYGSKFDYALTSSSKSIFGSIITTIAVIGFMTSIYIPIFGSIIRKLLPKPGEGPSLEQRVNGHLDFRLIGVSAPVSEKQPESSKKVYGRINISNDPGYLET